MITLLRRHRVPVFFAATLVALAACTKGAVSLGVDQSPDSLGSCDGEGGFGPQPHAVSDPSGIDPDKAIADLTDAEAEAWCTWFVGLPWFGKPAGPPPADAPVNDDGTVSDFPEGGVRVFGQHGSSSDDLCYLRPSIDQCVANLRFEGCGATVHTLDACAEALIFECGNPLAFCQPYMDECSETIIVHPRSDVPECRLPVQ